MELPDNIQELKDLVSLILVRLTYLEEENVVFKAENALLKTENAKLKVENAELRRRLNLKSHNSHKPPSSDGLSKKPGFPKRAERKPADNVGIRAKRLSRSPSLI